MKKIELEKIIGKKFGKLTALKEVSMIGRHRVFQCKCDCGHKKIAKLQYLRNGDTKSCGCSNKTRSIKHGIFVNGKKATKEYRIWASMIQRCENSNDKSYKYYGKRGITVCKKWHDFRNFIKDMGIKPKGKSIDRIDNNGNYCLSNCRWATMKEQSVNKRPYKKKLSVL